MLNILLRLVLSLFSPTPLAQATQSQAPTYLSEEEAKLQTFAAVISATPDIEAELLLAMAYIESRHQPEATSRVEGGVRVTGIPSWSSPSSRVTGPFFCGVTQAVAGLSWKRCLELRDIMTAYSTTSKELTVWLKACRGQISCALTGYGGGYPAIKAGTSTYPNRVLHRARLLKKLVGTPTI